MRCLSLELQLWLCYWHRATCLRLFLLSSLCRLWLLRAAKCGGGGWCGRHSCGGIGLLEGRCCWLERS